jgi:hypothetical protein
MKTILVLILISITSGIFAQNENLALVSNAEYTSVSTDDVQAQKIIRNIKAAKKSGDISFKKYWEEKLHDLTKPQIITSCPNNFKHRKENQEIYNGSEVLNFTRLTSGVILANAISRESWSGEVYAALGIWGGGGDNSDTLRVLRSTNNGITFTVIMSLFEGMKITANSLDIEAVSKMDSTFAFVSMDYTIGTLAGTAIVRTRQDGGMFNVKPFTGVTNRYINGRITSDNAAYTTAAYVYFSFTLDSLVSGTRRLRSKMCKLENPFSPDMNVTMGYQESGTGKYAYYIDGAAPDSAKFQSDICFVNTAGDSDQVYTVTVVRGVGPAFDGGASLHFSKSNSYGATAPSLFFKTDGTFIKENPRIASTGKLNNSIAVVSRRLLGGGIWQPYCHYSPEINSPLPTFLIGQVGSTSSDTTMGASVTGRYRSNGTYLFAWNNKFGSYGNVFTRPLTDHQLRLQNQSNPIIATDFYGTPDAAFRNVNNDSCLVIWGGISGNGSYVTGGCSGTFTSVENPNVNVSDYQLYQNYPNPFNPSTKISYNLPVNSSVSIKLFDVIGKQVAEIVSEVQRAGLHSVEFNGVNLSSGVYYYRIEANDFIDTKKMILIK